MPRIAEIWVYLSASPLLWLTLTLLAYQAAQAISQRCKHHPLTNPVALAVALLVPVLVVSNTPYAVYFDGAKFVHFLLGPATVALAVPLYQSWPRWKPMVGPVLIGLVTGSLVAVLSAVTLGALGGASHATLMSLVPKSVTTPIAMGIAEKIGGLPSLAAALVLLTGIIGAVAGPGVFRLLGIRDPAAQGVALGVSAHGIGTARAFQSSPESGALSALAMGLNALVTASLVPLLLPALRPWLP
jgi:predicted murein hydrolase (TIGR00659 family)